MSRSHTYTKGSLIINVQDFKILSVCEDCGDEFVNVATFAQFRRWTGNERIVPFWHAEQTFDCCAYCFVK